MLKTLVTAAAIACLSFSFGGTSAPKPLPGDDLKMNQIQVVASHNSYHLHPDKAVLRFLKMMYLFHVIPRDLNPSHIDYVHEPLTQQLEQYHLHGLELDLWNDPKGGNFYRRQGKAFAWKSISSHQDVLKKPGFKVLHISDFDFNTTNFTFVDALQEIKTWSDAHPTHLPVFINIELKTVAPGDRLNLPRSTHIVPFDSTAAIALDNEVKSVFGQDLNGVITPDMIKGNYPTLEKAVLAGNWLPLSQARGKIVFIIDANNDAGVAYKAGHPSLSGRAMFVYSKPGTPEAAFVKLVHPTKQVEQIRDCVAKGYIVRTQCDAETVEARSGDYTRVNTAINNWVQILSTDYYHADPRAPKHGFTDYHVSLPNGQTARVDSLAAPDKVGIEVGE